MNTEVDVGNQSYQIWENVAIKCYQIWQKVAKIAKNCRNYQIWQKVAKVPKQCYQMWQNVAKGVPRGFKRSQGVPNCSKGSKGKMLHMWQKNAKGVLRESATRCGKKSPKGFQKSSKVVQLYLVRRTGSNACLRCWPEGPAPKAPSSGPEGP